MDVTNCVRNKMTEHHNDIPQRFNGSSTAFQVLHGRDLSGQVAIVTGANVGIGFETAKSLATYGCHVILACRNLQSAEEAIELIRTDNAKAADACVAMKLDLASLNDVLAFVKAVKNKYSVIHMLILNAGVFGLPYTRTVDNYETTFQVCHLSHFYLTLLLKPTFIQGSRIVVVSSESHRYSNLRLDSLTKSSLSPDTASKYSYMMAYNNAKLCNVLFAMDLAKRWQDLGVSVFSLHPGYLVATHISRNWWLLRVFFALVRPFTKSLQQAASTSVYCATAQELHTATGLYFNNCARCSASAAANNIELAGKLWRLGEEMIRTTLGPDAPGLSEENTT
ncbi:WW domain containing oxidoreductase [Carabus blaptoides fortunei]